MKHAIAIILCICSYLSLKAQADTLRNTYRISSQIKFDLLGTVGEYPSLSFGYEHPLKGKSNSIEHEFGFIFDPGNYQNEIEKIGGFKTSHTYQVHSKNNNYVIGLGVHYRQLNVKGRITVCESGTGTNVAGCSYFRLYDENIRIHRWAGYARFRRNVFATSRISVSAGVDLGALTQYIQNPEFGPDGLILRRRWFRQDLNARTGAYYRLHFQMVYRL